MNHSLTITQTHQITSALLELSIHQHEQPVYEHYYSKPLQYITKGMLDNHPIPFSESQERALTMPEVLELIGIASTRKRITNGVEIICYIADSNQYKIIRWNRLCKKQTCVNPNAKGYYTFQDIKDPGTIKNLDTIRMKEIREQIFIHEKIAQEQPA